MRTSISITSTQQTVPLEALLRGATQAGFEAVELTLADDAVPMCRAPKADYDRLADCVRQVGLVVSSLVGAGTLPSKLLAADHAVRRAACQQAVAAMDRARWLGTDVLVLPLPPGIGGTPAGLPGSHGSYETTYAQALEAFQSLRFEAERRAVRVVCGNAWNHFLASPFVMRRFIDELSTPWIGASLDISNSPPAGSPGDWIRLLGHRLARIYAGETGGWSAERHEDTAETENTMRHVRYDGPITYHGAMEPQQAMKFLKSLFAN